MRKKDPVKGENEKNEENKNETPVLWHEKNFNADYDCHSDYHHANYRANYHDHNDYDTDYFLQREFDEDDEYETEAINEFVFNNMFT